MADPVIPAAETPLNATTKSSLDIFLENEEAELQTRLQGEENPEPATPPAEPAAEPEAPPVEEPPAETPPAAEPPAEPAEPAVAPPPVEAKAEPEEEPGEDGKPRKRPSWKMIRELEDQIKQERRLRQQGDQTREQTDYAINQLREQIAELRGAKAPDAEVIPDDPLTKVEKEVEQLRQRDQQRDMELRQRDQIDAIRQQEADFVREQPKYREAVDFLRASEREEAEARGELDAVGRDLMRRFGPRIRETAMQSGRDEVEVARDYAANLILEARRQALVNSAAMAGKSVPQATWDWATRRGYKPEPVAVTPPPKPAPKKDPAEVRAASESLSAIPSSAPPPPPKTLRSRKEVMALPMEVLEPLILRLDEESPGWLERLPQD